MKHRKDITEDLVHDLGVHYRKKAYRIYEHDGLLYAPHYDEDGSITHFSDIGWLSDYAKSVIINTFNVRVAEPGCDIVCKCGESKFFSAFYGNYRISLRCNKCGNEFSAYSG